MRKNLLLSNISAKERKRLSSFLEPVDMKFKEPLHEKGKPIKHVYFPINFVASSVIEMEDGEIVEVGVTGNEGLVGIELFLKEETTNSNTFAQVPGEGLRMKAADFKKHVMDEGGLLQDLLHRYTHAFMAQISQTAACNRVHPLDQRLCRWILMTHNRVQSSEFLLTQEFMGQMLGVRRPTVSTTANILQKAGLISFSRGRLKVLDRAGLENGTCECYWMIVKLFDHIYGETWPPPEKS
ncbi:MAG TPA: Crp/Fnr family transcriptional regulator [Pyrinomonadaceae bacterium]|jgi:CRP-like cAMP-binding protein